jgi:uncharacterized protein (DUF433 family)
MVRGAPTKDSRFTAGLMNLTEAGRHLGVPQQTFHRWARGYHRGEPLLHVLDRDNILPVTFIALAEAYVLDALRKAGVRPQRIRPALKKLEKEFGKHYVLVAKELATDGIDVLWDFSRTPAGDGLIAADTGQHVIREIVKGYISYVNYDSEGIPRQLQLPVWLPSKVIVDVERSFGQPIFAGSGVRVTDVAGMIKAGDSAETVADEFGLEVADVRTSARILLGRAA